MQGDERRIIKFRVWQGGRFHYWGFIKSEYGEDYEFHSLADTNFDKHKPL